MKRSLIWDNGISVLYLTTLKVNGALMVVLFFFQDLMQRLGKIQSR